MWPRGNSEICGLVPHISFVVLDFLFGEEFAVFLLEGFHPMVLFLVADVVRAPFQGCGVFGAPFPGRCPGLR